MPDETKATPTTAGEPQPGGAAQPAGQVPQFAMDTSNLSTVYTNFCHVTFLPEELILDFGLNTQMAPNPNQPVKLTHRVVMNFFTAKRLLNGLHFAVSRYESAFGVLELDFQKRARMPSPPPPPRPGGGFQ
jgi:hypothetical protein